MKINFNFEFPFTALEVFKAYRDGGEDYAKFIPNVTGIKILERTKIGKDKTSVKSLWNGSGSIPLIVRPILKPDMVCWEEDDIWNESSLSGLWEIKPVHFTQYVTCKGLWTFEDDGKDKCSAHCEGIFKVWIDHFPRVPDAISHKAGPIIEKIVGGYLEPNMLSSVKGIKKMLDEKRKKKK